jgi:hypothetical protein
MSIPENDNELENMLTETFGPPPSADIHAWRQRHPGALAWLNPQRFSSIAIRRKRMQRIIILTATAAATICVWLGVAHFDTSRPGPMAFGDTIEQIQKAKTITWKTTIYERVESKDGKRHWYRAEQRKFAYKSPGLYRETDFDQKGNTCLIEITDVARKKILTLYPINKVAVVAEDARVYHDLHEPFDDAQSALKNPNLRFVEKRKTANGEVNVFRHVEGRCFFDCWIDMKSKQLVEYRINQGDNITLTDYENDPMRNAKPDDEDSGGSIVGSIDNEINYNADLDDSLFQFDIPEGYKIETKKRHYVTEQEMIDFIRILADENGQIFPDQILDIPSERYNKYRAMPKSERSPQAQKLIDIQDHYDKLEVRGGPVRGFLEKNAAEWLSFRYLGKGVKIGDKDAFVCWYRLKDSKDPDMYRVVYGDLSVKDVAAKDLPLPVDP